MKKAAALSAAALRIGKIQVISYRSFAPFSVTLGGSNCLHFFTPPGEYQRTETEQGNRRRLGDTHGAAEATAAGEPTVNHRGKTSVVGAAASLKGKLEIQRKTK